MASCPSLRPTRNHHSPMSLASPASRPSSTLPSLASSTGFSSASTSLPPSPSSTPAPGRPGGGDVFTPQIDAVKPKMDVDLHITKEHIHQQPLVKSAQVQEIKKEIEKEREADDPDAVARAHRLRFLLEKSTIYARIIGDRMARQQIEKREAEKRAAARKATKESRAAEEAAATSTSISTTRGGMRSQDKNRESQVKVDVEKAVSNKRKSRKSEGERESKKAKVEVKEMEIGNALENEGKIEVNPEVKDQVQKQSQREEWQQTNGRADHGDREHDPGEEGKQYSFAQPELITGAKLRDYQLAGVQWMISLYENGLNGILADEMGLGKTLQTISFLAHLRSKGTWGPFLIVCPLSVLNNWITEFEKFAPSIPTVMYHGSPEHRAELRHTRLQAPASAGVGNIGKGRKSFPATKGAKNARKSMGDRPGTNTTATFPVVVTTYDICMIDRSYLNGFQWKFVVVDEGHRLKNLDCKLIRELKSYHSANRMIITGTPLHNNLAELWSLLNFILPDIFDDLDSFQQWFNFDDMSNSGGLLDKGAIVSSLHAILKPFLLRRLKTEVERDLPPKKEYLLTAPLTAVQKDMYQAILSRSIREYLIAKKSGTNKDEEEGGAGPEKAEEVRQEDDGEEEESEAKRKIRKQARKNYKIEENDSKWIRDLENGVKADERIVSEKSAAEISQEWSIQQATKSVNAMHLKNLVMQLRKVSNHPFLFDWPVDPNTGDWVINDDLVNASGKMLLLNRLLDALFEKGHKVLLFSQFKTMLDVIEDWAVLYKKWQICRIDGSTSQESRRQQMNDFNNGGDKKGAPNLFLLSTRAGGLGINLVAADTVIFFDQDWNPQMDLQAQDRAHRIGQTKPVLVFRLVSAHTIESKILQKAGNKRKLEALVISQGKFGKMVDENGKVILGREKHSSNTSTSTAELTRALLDLEGEEIDVASAGDQIISDADLEILLDRSEEAFKRGKGWSAGVQGKKGESGRDEKIRKGERTAFEVFVSAKDEASDELARMFEGDGEGEAEQA